MIDLKELTPTPDTIVENDHVEPFAVLNGHETEVTALCEVTFDYTECVCSGMSPCHSL